MSMDDAGRTIAVSVFGPIFRNAGRGRYERTPGAARAINWLRAKGWKILVVTPKVEALAWLERITAAGIRNDGVCIGFIPTEARLYVDASAIRFFNWGRTLELIKTATRRPKKRARKFRRSS